VVEIDKDKVQAVYKYLQEEFPGCDIIDKYDFFLRTPNFGVECGKLNYILKFYRDIWDDHNSYELYELLKRLDTAKQMQENTNCNMSVTSDGLKPEPK
jgi:hypothetical protein